MTKTYGNFTDFIDFSRASSGTYLGSDGLLKTAADNVPRVEYDSSGVLKGLLIEEQRTNLVTTSEALSGGNWFNNGGTITENIVTAPDGTLTGSTYSTDGAYRILRNVATVSSSTTYTWSFYAKNIDATSLHYRVYDNTNAADIVVATSYFSDVSTTEWARIVVTFTTPATCTNLGVYVCSGDIGGTAAFWGAQLEQGSFPTSYIPTSGATATRSADIASIDVANFGYNQKAGTVVVEFNVANWANDTSANYSGIWEFYGNIGSNADGIFRSINIGAVRYRFNEDDSTTAALGAADLDAPSDTGFDKVAVGLKSGSNYIIMNGGTSATGTGTAATNLYSSLYIGRRSSSVSHINGHIKSIKYLPRRLTNTQLQEQTA